VFQLSQSQYEHTVFVKDTHVTSWTEILDRLVASPASCSKYSRLEFRFEDQLPCFFRYLSESFQATTGYYLLPCLSQFIIHTFFHSALLYICNFWECLKINKEPVRFEVLTAKSMKMFQRSLLPPSPYHTTRCNIPAAAIFRPRTNQPSWLK
jgi:hypothetical protein